MFTEKDDLRGKVAVVTGASKGIGLAIVDAFSREGVHVVAGSRRPSDALTQLAQRSSVLPISGDLTTLEGPEVLVKQALHSFGGLDILINNLGGGFTARLGGFLAISDEEWQHVFQVNLLSAIRASRVALPYLIERKGSILNIVSVNAHQPNISSLDYSAMKAALLNLTKSLSEEFVPRGVRVNAVSPGLVRTPGWEGEGGWGEQISQAVGISKEAFLQALPQRSGVTLGRMIHPEEIADLVVYLTSDHSRMITGAEFVIDGGLLKVV